MTTTLKRAVPAAFLVGVIIPCSIELVGHFLDAINVHPGMWVSNLVVCVWPTGIVLMDTSDNWQGYVAFAITAVLNGMLYAFVVLIIGYLISSFKRDKTQIEGW
jgi:low affinity Fe/Cu permease